MRVLVKFLDIIDITNEWIGSKVAYVTLILMLVVVYDVTMRYVFTQPTIWGFEVAEWLLSIMALLGGGYCFLHGGHVKVDILYMRFSPRVKAILDLVTYLGVFVVCIVLLKYGGELAWKSLICQQTSGTMWDPPVWPIRMLCPIGAGLIFFQCLGKTGK